MGWTPWFRRGGCVSGRTRSVGCRDRFRLRCTSVNRRETAHRRGWCSDRRDEGTGSGRPRRWRSPTGVARRRFRSRTPWRRGTRLGTPGARPCRGRPAERRRSPTRGSALQLCVGADLGSDGPRVVEGGDAHVAASGLPGRGPRRGAGCGWRGPIPWGGGSVVGRRDLPLAASKVSGVTIAGWLGSAERFRSSWAFQRIRVLCPGARLRR